MSTRQSADIDFEKPLLLQPDNFTPLTRTPWAGKTIAALYKQNIVPGCYGMMIGESWEFSCDPDFPSILQDYPVTLPDLIDSSSDEFFGKTTENRSCEILVKLLNAEEPLSVQVHPRDDDPDLKPGECGKPESWYVLHAEPGAGLYLGFSQPMSRDGNGKQLLQFVPVKRGDYFEIEPGVPHCIGPGVTLLEPQRITPGKSGKTYRMWDFDRRYNAEGAIDMQHGKPRELHLEAGLKLVDPRVQTGTEWLKTLRREPAICELAPGVTAEVFPANQWYRTMIIRSQDAAEFKLNVNNGYASVTTLAGGFSARGVTMQQGRTALIAAAALPLPVSCTGESMMAVVCPAYCDTGVL
jgi:mannose-6-phosphate isomerase